MIWLFFSIIAYLACGLASPWLLRLTFCQSYTVDENWEVVGWLLFWPLVWLILVVSESCNKLFDFIRERLMS